MTTSAAPTISRKCAGVVSKRPNILRTQETRNAEDVKGGCAGMETTIRKPGSTRAILVAILAGLAGFVQQAAAQTEEPIVYTIRVALPETQFAEVEASAPTGNRASVEMMMPIWSPGYYRVEDYAGRVQDFAARKPDGTALDVEKTRKNRWQIRTNGAPAIVVSYRLLCAQRSVTTNWISPDLGVFNGAATFITLVETTRRPHEVHLELPPTWKRAMT